MMDLNEKHTIMENQKKRMFIVSFGNSRHYKVEYTPKAGDSKSAAMEPMVKYENELNSYLAEKYPGDSFAYYTTPRITEVDPKRADEFRNYPNLDQAAVDDIKRELNREVEVMNDARMRDNNDGWGNIGSTPATNDE